MSELEFGKSVDEIEAPQLLPEGWYEMEVTQEPEVLPNEAMKANPADEKVGHNWVVRMKTASEEPMYDGRRFTIWLGVPAVKDEVKWTSNGQKVSDAKMQRIVGFVEAFGGTVGGKAVALRQGARGQAYVLQQINKQTSVIENTVDIFNQGFKKSVTA
jgi:hypothetical protein